MSQDPVHKDGNEEVKVELEGGKKSKKNKEPLIGILQYYRYATPLDWVFILTGFFFALLKGFSWPGVMVIFGKMIETLGTEDQDPKNDPNKTLTDHMFIFAMWYVGFGFFNILAGYLATALLNISAERQASRVRRAYFRALLRQEIGWYDSVSSGELTTRLSKDVEMIRDGLSDKTSLFIQWLFCFIGGVCIAFAYSWRLSLVILAVAPLLGGTGALFAKVMADFTATEQTAYAAAGAVAQEVIGGMRTVVAFGGEEAEVKRYKEKLSVTTAVGRKNMLLYAASMSSNYLIMFLMYALAFWYGSKLTGGLKTGPGDVVIAFFNVFIGAWGLGLCAPQWKVMAVGRGAASKVYNTIDRVSKINHEDESGKTIPGMVGEIEFKDCHFHYPSRPDVTIMDGFSLKLDPGKTHALVGPSGCGKSTAVSLLERFYQLLKGEILLDGVDIKDLNVQWLREQIGYVGQEPVLFSTTVEENVRYGREGISKNDIIEACKKAFAHDFISDLPDGYSTLCGERGSQMSGGQKQRIAIARALVRDPKILLLDEATSALDTKSEKIVQQALDKAREGRTTLIIAHRLSTIRHVDKICAISEGRVVEEGTHTELMAREAGLYRGLLVYQEAVQNADDNAMSVPGIPTSGTKKYNIDDDNLKDSLASKGLKKNLRLDSTKSEASIKSKEEEDENKEEKEHHAASFLTIMRECNRSEIIFLFAGSLGAAVNGISMPVFAVLFANVLYDLVNLSIVAAKNEYLETPLELDYGPTNQWALYFVYLAVGVGIAYFVQIYCIGLMSESFVKRLRIRSFRALLRQNMAYFDDPANSIGALTTRLATEANSVKDATGNRVAIVIQVAVGMTAGVVLAMFANWKIALVCIACIPFIVVSGLFNMVQITGTSRGVSKLYEASGKTAAEAIENIRTVASLGLENMFYQQYCQSLKAPFRASSKKAHSMGLCMGLSEAMTYFTFAAVFGYGSTLMEKGETNFDEVMEVFSAIIFTAMTIGEAMAYMGDYKKATIAAAKILKLIYSEPVIDAYSEDGLKEFEVNGKVTFSDVTFNYPTRPDQPILQGLTLEAERGQTVALVGQSGCGKSTTIQLTERFYNALSGHVFLDDRKLTDINVTYLRKQIGLVSQEPILFDTTIADNIKYGDLTRDISQSDIVEAAKSANIHDFIAELPEGYETTVGEKGGKLSGGQKQRIAIARALIRNPKILLLDEATSALDTESEKVVQDALDKARQGRTCLVIAHRLSTIHTADLICVIEEGRVAEQGTHQELMAMKGIYYTLNTQNKEE